VAKIKWCPPYCRESLHGKYWVACNLNPYQIPIAGKGIRALDAAPLPVGWFIWLGFDVRLATLAVGQVEVSHDQS